MKALLVGDVGGVDAYHAGDEAMLDAAIAHLRRRGDVAVTVVSGNPTDTSIRYGVDAVARLGFAGRDLRSDDERDRRLAAVLALADGDESDDELLATGGATTPRQLVEAVASADAVVVTGGGNLSSSWPDHVYERAAVLLLARRFGIPTVVSSQTIGPSLSSRQTALLARALDGVSLVGLRERASYHLSSRIVPATTRRCLQLDDAMFLPGEPPAVIGDALLDEGFVALTVNALGVGRDATEQLSGVAELVATAHALTGLPVLFLPHVGGPAQAPIGDVAVGRSLRDRLGDGPELAIAPVLPAREIAWLTRRASAIITTRYHPAVFATGAAVPCLAIHQDRYTAVKLRGALDHAGLAQWTIPLDAVRSGLAADAFGELWRRRGELASHLREVSAGWPARDAAHWDDIWDTLQSTPRPREPGAVGPRHADQTEPHGRPAAPVRLDRPPKELSPKLDSWGHVNAVDDAWMERFADEEHQLHAALQVIERQERSLEAQERALGMSRQRIELMQADLVQLDLRRATIEAEKIQLLDETVLAELSAHTARELLADVRQRLAVESAERTARQEHLEALFATKTFRWTKRPRRLYGRLRRLFRYS